MFKNKNDEIPEKVNSQNILISTNKKQNLNNIENHIDINTPSNSNEKTINAEIISIINNNKNNNELKFKIDESIDNNSLDGVKQDIINFYLIEKQKYEEKKKEIETTKNFNYNLNSKKAINNFNTKTKRTKSFSTKRLKQNRFEKYDKEKISYEIYHQYQKLNFNYKDIPFIERMELYSLKKCLKDYKVEELTNLRSPKISEKEIVQTFNRLIEDSNRRLLKSSIEHYKSNKNKTINNNIKNIKKENKAFDNNRNDVKKNDINKVKRSFSKKKWDEIYEKRFCSKLKQRNNKLEKMRKEKEEKIKKEEDTIIDNLNKKEELMNQRYGMKRNKSANNLTKNSINSLNKNKYYIGNSKIVANLNQRLYYNEISKKDIDYKILKEKAKQLIDDNSYENNINNNKTEKGKKSTNKNLEKKKNKYSINSFRKGFDSNKKKKQQNNSDYNFKSFSDDNEEEKNNNNNFIKIIKNIDTFKISETSIDNNTKFELTGSPSYYNNNRGNAEKIIDKFFEN